MLNGKTMAIWLIAGLIKRNKKGQYFPKLSEPFEGDNIKTDLS